MQPRDTTLTLAGFSPESTQTKSQVTEMVVVVVVVVWWCGGGGGWVGWVGVGWVGWGGGGVGGGGGGVKTAHVFLCLIILCSLSDICLTAGLATINQVNYDIFKTHGLQIK